jgi:hypothetical protein
MRHIYILFSEIGWAWAVVVGAFLLFVKPRSDRDRHEEQH